MSDVRTPTSPLLDGPHTLSDVAVQAAIDEWRRCVIAASLGAWLLRVLYRGPEGSGDTVR